MERTVPITSALQLAVVVRDARLTQGLTQAELASKIGVSRVWVNQFEQGKMRNAKLGTLLAMLDTLNISLTLSYKVDKPQPANPLKELDTAGAVASPDVSSEDTLSEATSKSADVADLFKKMQQELAERASEVTHNLPFA